MEEQERQQETERDCPRWGKGCRGFGGGGHIKMKKGKKSTEK